MNQSVKPDEGQIGIPGESERIPLLWLVIPIFNDTSRLALFLPKLCAELECLPLRVVVQVVDDGSAPADQSALDALIRETQARFPFVRAAIFQSQNYGKGGAILRGWEAQEGADWLGFLDADGSVPAYEVRRMLGLILTGSNEPRALFASRIRMRGVTVERSLKRHLMGRVFATLVGSLIDPEIYDSQCGFKLIPRAAYLKVKPFLKEMRFAFDVELLAALNRFQYPVQEVPVDWFDVPGSKVSLFRDSFRMLRAVLLIRSRFQSAGTNEAEAIATDRY